MAGFTTHLSGAALTAGVVASSLALTDLFSIKEIATLWAVGVAAGLLPDIDSDASVALKALFSALGVLASLGVLVYFSDQPLIYLWGMMLSAFVLLRFVIMEAFMRFTVHRGSLHSVLAGVMFGVSTVAFAHYGLLATIDYAWALGLVVFAGYLTHLLLDELYAVNLSGAELKRSFGSALKLLSLKYVYTSIAFGVLSVYLLATLPKPERLHRAFLDAQTKERIIGTLEWLQAENHRIFNRMKREVAEL